VADSEVRKFCAGPYGPEKKGRKLRTVYGVIDSEVRTSRAGPYGPEMNGRVLSDD
jgi:hypothetical protein